MFHFPANTTAVRRTDRTASLLGGLVSALPSARTPLFLTLPLDKPDPLQPPLLEAFPQQLPGSGPLRGPRSCLFGEDLTESLRMHLCWVKAQRWPCRSQGCFPLEPESFSHPTHRRRERRASQASCTRQPCSAPAASGPGLALGAGKRNQFSRPDGSADTYPSVPFFHSVLQLLRGFLRNVNNRLLWLEVICTRQGEKAEITGHPWGEILRRQSRFSSI